MNEVDILEIKEKFYSIGAVSDLAELLNVIDSKTRGEKPVLSKITERDLNYLSVSKDRRYREFELKKKSGGIRTISSPDNYLKRVQHLLNHLLQVIFNGHINPNCNGFIQGRNIYNNAERHTSKRFVLNIDLKDFFPSVEFRRIKTVLELRPFNLNNGREPLGFLIANITTHNNFLPQGAPTSPVLSNIICQRLDRRLTKFAFDHKVSYSRYADDLTFSTNREVINDEFKIKIENIINGENFEINPKKTRLQTSMDRQEVTGLIVNKKVNTKRSYINCVRAILHNWEIKGSSYAQQIYQSHRLNHATHPDFKNVLRGRINFIGSIRGKNDSTYLKLKKRFEYQFHRINFEKIEHKAVKKRLNADNYEMEMILVNNFYTRNDPEDNFVSFCTKAFYQIENLLNYFYWKRFTDINNFIEFIWNENDAFKNKYKRLKKCTKEERSNELKHYKKISDFDINMLLYLFEKEFYFNTKAYYNRDISYLREIRNDGSHRCSVYNYNQDEILKESKALNDRKRNFKENKGRYMVLQAHEIEIEYKMRLITFLNERSYNKVREIISKVLKRIVDFNFDG